MKQLIIVLLTLIAMGCGESIPTQDELNATNMRNSGKTVNQYYIMEMTYDSCEYLVSGYGNSQMMTHKGNCKYCQQRNNHK
jgi:hypothetical protein